MRLVLALLCSALAVPASAPTQSGTPATVNSQTRAVEITAPFGLRWGATPEESERAGVGLQFRDDLSDDDEPFLKWAQISSVPQPSDQPAKFISGAFSAKYGLQKVIWRRKDIDDKPDGRNGKKNYSDIKAFMTSKYGPAQSIESVAHHSSRGGGEFYSCLKRKGCGVWKSSWTGADGSSAYLILDAQSADEGTLTLHYHGPRMPVIKKQIDAARTAGSKKAF